MNMRSKVEEALDYLFREAGLPTPGQVMEARETVKRIFPKPKCRLAFALSLIDECADALNMTSEGVMEFWKEER